MTKMYRVLSKNSVHCGSIFPLVARSYKHVWQHGMEKKSVILNVHGKNVGYLLSNVEEVLSSQA